MNLRRVTIFNVFRNSDPKVQGAKNCNKSYKIKGLFVKYG